MSQATSSALPLVREVQALLRTRRFGKALRGYPTVDSTNTTAMHWANDGAPEGSVVIAEYQRAGRGRHGRAWLATPGQNLTFSVVLRPSLPPPRLNLITLAASIAIAETVEAYTATLTTSIKWPNDVLLEGYKCCGMLLESTLAGPTGTTVILGIGLNVNQRTFPTAFEGRATSLLLQTGQHVPRAPLLAELLGRLEQYYETLGTDDEAEIRRAYERRLHGLGRTTTLCMAGHEPPITGLVLGITDTGALRLHTDDGPRTFHAGEIRLANTFY